MFKHRVVVAVVVAMLVISLTGAGSILAQSGPSGLTETPLTPDSTDQVTKPDAPNGGQPSRSAPTASANGTEMVSVIVKLDVASVASYTGGLPGLPATNPKAAKTPSLDVNSASVKLYQSYVDGVQQDFQASVAKTIPSAQVINQYDLIFGGVSMILPADQISTLTKMPGVVAVYPDELLHLDTDNSPQFIGAPTAWNLGGGQEKAGEGVVVGVLDTGIWPEHPSFSDPDPSGKPYQRPASWHGTVCNFGSSAPGDAPFTCTNKLVGAARFMNTYSALIAPVPGEFPTARDDDGHGTHTSSTAAGNASVASSIFGVPRGIVSGIAPRASVAMYKVCGLSGCYSSDSAAAVEQAIIDGVNVINFSISGGSNPYSDAVSQAFLDAYNAGVFVAASAGNSGPTPETTDHREPWVTTVAASTQNRAFQTTATVTGSGGASLALDGTSITAGTGPAPVYVPSGSTSAIQCDTPLAPGSVTGMVVVCRRGNTGRAQKGYNVLQGGAVGMILYNQSTAVTDLETDNHFLPAVQIQYTQGQSLLAFLAANPGATASWAAGAKVSAQGDVMASFSSRGGPAQSLGVSKPDITAPGVQILAGLTPMPVQPPYYYASGPAGQLFQAIAGTSMSSPHIAGSGALIKWLHPNWTPGQIKSALMTTAVTQVVKEDGVTPATPFDDGSGRVNLNKAGTAGLTFDESGANYVAYQTHLWDANYPSLYVPVMPGSISVKRKVHNESRQAKTYTLSVTYPSTQPSDMTVLVPKSIRLAGNGWALFEISVNAPTVPLGEVRFATLWFTSGSEQLHFPITIVRNQPVVTLAKTCDPLTIHKYDPAVGIVSTTTCNITMQNTSFLTATVSLYDRLPNQLKLVSVTGGSGFAYGVTFDGTLAPAQPPSASVAAGTPPFGYYPVSGTPISGVGDETITNFTVPAFTYGGQTYTRVGMVSDGYLVIGGGTSADIQYLNQNLPDTTRPNNVLAPFWTDLNPAFGGAMRATVLSDGTHSWIVFDWQGVVNYSDRQPNTFQVWLPYATNTGTVNGVPANQIFFAYGPITNGEGGAVTIGAENIFGNRGQNYYYNGTGTLPVPDGGVFVNSAAGAPGEAHVVTLTAKGAQLGKWVNCAELDSNLIAGTNIACSAQGEVIK